MKRYVVYLRVSTKDQGKSGLGLEAQQRDIALFLEAYTEVPYEVLAEFTEIESGADNERPELAKALDMVRRHKGAELLVAKLDRLSRRVSFISTLMDDPKVQLKVASMPQADKFALHIYAALAEQERDFISARTKNALQAAKARGTKLGGLRDATMRRNTVRAQTATQEARKLEGVVRPMRDAGKSLRDIAGALNGLGYKTPRGGDWVAATVKRVLDRL
ncbi:DNA invertase [Alsobacter soli]|uniref:DNA invertase n=1 Tax=Alsobacter soli TaxID=2109933 RepID=A0A2T1HYF3_9HYPH|nr:recombinase family protein [Alsobacter soli]PSC06723.1 DNA invertase [Alsobacter soli]